MLVLFTTIVFGGLMPFFIKFFTSLDTKEQSTHAYIEMTEHEGSVDFGYLHPNFTDE